MSSPASVYYFKTSNTPGISNQIIPSPQIQITPAIYYANNIAIGYTYNITLEGYAVSVSSPFAGGDELYNIMLSIQKIKNLFLSNNGGNLLIQYKNSEVLKAIGGQIKEINFQETDNYWSNYAKYSIEIEFNDLILNSSCSSSDNLTITCGTIPPNIQPSPNLVDMEKYKIKSFNDSWNITIDQIYNSYDKYNNSYFNIEYDINATGKHYFNDGDAKLLPAWQQAKQFCQDRLVKQITGLTDKTLSSPEGDGCVTDGKKLLDIFSRENSDGILYNIDLNSEYKLFDENIVYVASESDGSFNLNYKALIKKLDSDDNVIHTFSVTKNVTDNMDANKNIIYSVQGEIKGLAPGPLFSSGIFTIPSNGLLFTDKINPKDGQNFSKYHQAKIAYDKIGSSDDLKSDFVKDTLEITYGLFELNDYCSVDSGDAPKASTFSLNHNYNKGSITYSATYDGTKICATGINDGPEQTINFSIQDEIPMVAEFIVPGRSGGPIIQRLGINSPRKYTLSIEGINASGFCNVFDIKQLICGSGSGINAQTIAPGIYAEFSGLYMTENKLRKNNNGTYSLNQTYIDVEAPI